ncbi:MULTISPECIES: hypothetical protein [Paraburkholderia]|jgi:hypothetical protein|uniref:DUF962 domain-containing protein n=1 Tax=Paraburkholderia dipogonis TaxID=1211383 RepID=A0ABW9AT37_9BURK
MRTRSALEICLPLALFVAACALSLPTLVIAFVWMTIGVVSLGHRTLDSFPTDGVPREWHKGYRGACLWFYHLTWWPWYMRSPLRDIADRIGRSLSRRRNPSDNVLTDEHMDGSVGEAPSKKRD